MIAAWILYAIVVGTLVAAGAWALERALRTHGFPSRWVWAAAILLSVGWPLGHRVLESHAPPAQARAVPAPTAPAGPDFHPEVGPQAAMALEVPPESILRSLDGPILLVWGTATSILFFLFSLLLVRTRRLRRRWRLGEAGGEAVLFSDEWGPAVVGFLQPQVVLPRWCRDLDEMALRFILDHELEHVRAWDLRLLILAGIVPVLFPWHLPVWWQLARLRIAVEGDCDLRVLGLGPGRTRPYVELLLDLGGRASPGGLGAALLSEPYQTLERRIRIMTMPMPKRPRFRGGILAGVGILLLAIACWAPGPVDAPEEGVQAGSEVGEIAGTVAHAPSGEPLPFVQVFVPGTGRGTLSDREGRFLIQHVPAGSRTVVAELIGYGRVTEEVHVPPGTRTEVSFGLEVTAIRMDPLVVRVGPGTA